MVYRKALFLASCVSHSFDSAPVSLTIDSVKIPSVFLAVLMASAAAAVEAPDISEKALWAYKAMHKMNERPRSIASGFATRCSASSPGEIIVAAERYGPHYEPYVNVYMNDAAQNHFNSQAKGAYPPGSIVIKEKLRATTKRGNPLETAAIAGLIKYAPGYNPETHDWEFFFASADGKMERTQTKLASCAQCHRNTATDYIFGEFTWP